jgi:GAF domain-containing protein/two-component sensor histidine kinase
MEGERVVGVLYVNANSAREFTEEDLSLLRLFADQAAIAVENARMFDSAQRRIRDLEIINDVTELMATKLNPEELLRTIVSQVAERLECTHCTIFFPKDQEGEMYLVPEETYGERSAVIRSRRFRPGEGLAGWVFQHGEALVLPNAKEDERFVAAREEQDEPRSMLVAPVKVGDRTTGVISADQDEYGWFGESERRLLEALARQAGIAIERATGLKLLQGIGHRILSAPKVDEILHEIVQGALELTHGTSGVIYLIGEDNRSVARSYQYPDDFDHPPPRMDNEEGITRQVIREGQVRTFRDLAADGQVNPVLLEDHLIRSMIAVPMKSGDTVIGVLYLNDVHLHQFTDTEISLLTTLAGQASIAIENVRLLEARERQAEELKLLHQVSAGLMTLDLDPLLSFIIQGAMRLTETESGYIYLLSDDGWRITQSVAYPPDSSYPQSAPSEGGLTRYIFDHREPVFVDDTSQDERVNPAIRQQKIQSLVGQPLKTADQVIGILYLNDTSHRTFSPSERSLIATLAEQAAVAIYNARLFADSGRLSRGHQTLSSVGTKLMGMLDEKEVLAYVARSAADTLDCTHCTVFRVQEDQLVVETSQGVRAWSLLEGRQFELGQGLAGWVAREGKPLLVKDAKADERFDPGWSAPEPDPESLALAPILVGGQVYGVISAEQNQTHAFDRYDLQLLETLASQASQAIQNAQLFATRQRLETQLESLHQVVQEQSLDRVLERIVRGISAILGEGISPTINLYNEQTERFTHCHACGPLEEELRVPPRPGGTGQYVIGTGEPLYLPDVHNPPPGAPEVRQEAIAMGIQSFAAIPLKREEHIVGVLYVNAQKPLSFSPEARRVLALFAGQAAIAIHISQDLERKIRELEVLTEIGRTVSNLGIDQILDLVYTETSKIVDLGDAQVQIALYDREEDEVTFPLAVEQNDGEIIDIVRDSIRERFLFRAKVQFQKDLAQGALPEPLRQRFAERGIPLGNDPTVETGVENRTWLIHDQDRTYIARKGKGLYARRGQELPDRDEKLLLYEIDAEAVKQFQPRPRGSRFGLTEYVLDIQRPVLLRDEFRQEGAQAQDGRTDSFVLDLPMDAGKEEAEMVGVRVWRRFGKLDRPTNSWLGVPMIVQERAVGIISIQSLGEEAPVDEGQLKVLEVVANQAAVAIENARLYTEQQETIQALEEAQDKIRQLEQVRIMSNMAADFVHRVSNMAGTIPLRLQRIDELLDEELPKAKGILEPYLDGIGSDTEELLALSQRLRDPSQRMPTYELIDVSSLVSGLVREARLRTPRSVEVSYEELTHDLPPVHAIKIELEDAIRDVLTNAAEATINQAGRIEVSTAYDKTRRGWIDIKVKDEGYGIPEEVLPHVFSLFYTTKESGIGYGLWRTKNAVEAFGGEITLDSKVGEGTVVHIRLPAAKE